ncbi:MAG: ester cyclase [Thermoproteota archaeon]|nr:ester cyclase [Thermoproteota archaeon]
MVFTGTQTGDLLGLPATGKRFSVIGCSFGEFENGKLKGRRDYWDSESLTKQLVGDLSNFRFSLLLTYRRLR